MICPHCRAENQRSVVEVVRSTSGTEPKQHFFDEDGQEHFHNPNVYVTEFTCSNGHRFAERSSYQCSVCGYKACEAEIVAPTETETEPEPVTEQARPARREVITGKERKAINKGKRR